MLIAYLLCLFVCLLFVFFSLSTSLSLSLCCYQISGEIKIFSNFCNNAVDCVWCWCSDPQKQASRLSAGAVAGIVSAVVTVTLLLLLVAVLLMWRRRSQAAKHSRYSQYKSSFHPHRVYLYRHIFFTYPRYSFIFLPRVGIGVGDGGKGGGSAPPQIREKKYFSGKHHVVFGQLIYFWKKEEQAPFIFLQYSVFYFMCTLNSVSRCIRNSQTVIRRELRTVF